MDEIEAITGVSAAEIIARCEATFGNGRVPRVRSRRTTAARTDWRLLDLADLSDPDFIRVAHRILLSRDPAPREIERRLGELQGTITRIELIVRLGLSPEGRRASRPEFRGIGLPAIAAAARMMEAASRHAIGAAIMRRAERAVLARLVHGADAGRSLRRGVYAGVATSVVVAVIRGRRQRS